MISLQLLPRLVLQPTRHLAEGRRTDLFHKQKQQKPFRGYLGSWLMDDVPTAHHSHLRARHGGGHGSTLMYQTPLRTMDRLLHRLGTSPCHCKSRGRSPTPHLPPLELGSGAQVYSVIHKENMYVLVQQAASAM